MLKRVSLRNFKCFAEQDFDLAPLTLLTGVNGRGKSSFIQALLLTMQSDGDDLVINGDLVSLGMLNDILYEKRIDDSLSIIISDNSTEYSFVTKDGTIRFMKKNEPLESNLLYLNAERVGPRTSYPIPSSNDMLNKIGNAGEYAAHILEFRTLHGDTVVHDKLILADTHNMPLSRSIRTQTEAWLSRLSRPLRLKTTPHANMDIVNLEFSFFMNGLETRNYRATNVGFGLTYALPIIVAVLTAEKDDLIIIENPEAHLHPRGQAIIGEFLALAAASGLQMIVETHSDHVLNGIRVAVKQNKICCEDTKVHFFCVDNHGETLIKHPKLDKNGRFDFCPDDFFDEWDKQLTELL